MKRIRQLCRELGKEIEGNKKLSGAEVEMGGGTRG